MLILISALDFCHEDGQPCDKNKRTINTLTAILNEPLNEPDKSLGERDPEANRFAPTHHLCWETGSPCSRHKRALDHLAAAVEKITSSTDIY